MALLLPGVTGEQFTIENLNQDLVQASSTTDEEGVFILNDVPRGEVYTGVVITESDVFWQNDWLPGDGSAQTESVTTNCESGDRSRPRWSPIGYRSSAQDERGQATNTDIQSLLTERTSLAWEEGKGRRKPPWRP